MEYDRRILILDGSRGELQRLALDLLGRNFSVHYANDPAEAQLLAQEAQGQIGAVLVAPSVELDQIPDMTRRLSVQPSALIPMGARPAEREIAALAFHGVRWHLWDDPSDEMIRFVLSNVMSQHDPMELRFHPRVPSRVAATLEIEDQKGDVTIRDLSLGGACLLGQVVGEVDARGQLAFALEDAELRLPVCIAWCVEATGDAIGVAGIAFTEVGSDEGEALDRFVRSVITAQRITAPKP